MDTSTSSSVVDHGTSSSSSHPAAQPLSLGSLSPFRRSTSSAGAPATPTELQRALERLLAGAVRGAAIGLTLRGGLHIVGSLLTAISKRRKRAVALPAAVEDTLRYAAFLASLAGVYIGVDEGIAAVFGKEK
jgi:hypothetical protein